MPTRLARTIFALCLTTATASCSNGDQVSDPGAVCAADAAYSPKIDPADFSTTIDNQFYPLVPGTTYKFVDSDENVGQTVVTSDTKTILGVKCVVVHDYASTPDGLLLEDTWDYFAQDKAGNVWYFGEDTKAYVGAAISTLGSWLAGVSCAKPGIVMKAIPKVGDTYRQEYLVSSAEDEADVLAVDETITVKYGTFDHCLKTKDYTHLDPGNVENKYYCPGLGLVLTLDLVTVGTGPREELVSVTTAAGGGGPNTGNGGAATDGGAPE